MADARLGLAALLIVAFVLVLAGCSTVSGNSADDSEIVSALNLKRVGGGYEMNGDPFCRVDDILNDVDEVKRRGRAEGRRLRDRRAPGPGGRPRAPPVRPILQAAGGRRPEEALPPVQELSIGPAPPPGLGLWSWPRSASHAWSHSGTGDSPALIASTLWFPSAPEERGEGRRTYVHVEGLSEPLVASRSEKAILADVEAALTEAAGVPRRRRTTKGQESLL